MTRVVRHFCRVRPGCLRSAPLPLASVFPARPAAPRPLRCAGRNPFPPCSVTPCSTCPVSEPDGVGQPAGNQPRLAVAMSWGCGAAYPSPPLPSALHSGRQYEAPARYPQLLFGTRWPLLASPVDRPPCLPSEPCDLPALELFWTAARSRLLVQRNTARNTAARGAGREARPTGGGRAG